MNDAPTNPPTNPHTSQPTNQPTNQHGRRPGRGIRPWLILPKVFGVAALFGGLVAMAAIALTPNAPEVPNAPDAPEAPAYRFDDASQITMLRRVWLHVVLPGFAVSMVCGWALLLQHLKVFVKQRWLWAKAVSGWLLTAGIASSGYLVWRDGAVNDTALQATLFTSMAAAALVIFFGKHKPRLGRKAAR